MRDAIIHAIQCWRTLPGADSPEPSEAGSSTKGLIAISLETHIMGIKFIPKLHKMYDYM